MKFKLSFEITKEKFKRPLCTYYRGNISSLCLSYDQISMPRECVIWVIARSRDYTSIL